MRFHLVVSREVQNKARQIFAEQLKRTGLRDYELEVRSFSDDEVEMEATLVNTVPDEGAGSALVERLGVLPGARQAFWSTSSRG